MYTINIYKDMNQLDISFKDVQEENLDTVLETIEGGFWLYVKNGMKKTTLLNLESK